MDTALGPLCSLGDGEAAAAGASCLPVSQGQRGLSADPRNQARPGSTQRVPSCISTSRKRGGGAQAGSPPPHTRGHHQGFLSSVQHGLHSWHHTRRMENRGSPCGVHRPARQTRAPAANACETRGESARWAPQCSSHKLCEKLEEKPHPDTQFSPCTILNREQFSKGANDPPRTGGEAGSQAEKECNNQPWPLEGQRDPPLRAGQDKRRKRQGAGTQVRPSRELPAGLEPHRKNFQSFHTRLTSQVRIASPSSFSTVG